ncbi:DUF4251 domain-containing protein [bacterium]|nr:DUF4251 domain-containing protein [bacterium]
MKKIAASVVILLYAIAAAAQEEVPLTKQEKKALKEEQKRQNEAILATNTAEALKSGQFVLKANQLRGRGGSMMNVNPTTNFVAVEGKDAYFQMASFTGVGYNGLGGVTLKGRITSFEMNEGKKNGSYTITMNTIGNGGNLTIMMNINKTGEMASASVTSNTGNRIDMYGVLVPWTGTGTQIYKGKESY